MTFIVAQLPPGGTPRLRRPWPRRWRRRFDEPDERVLCELCCLLAMYDIVACIGLSPASPLATLAFDASVED